MGIERFTDGETIAPDTVRKRPCIPEGGGCRIASRRAVFDDGGHIAATDRADADAFAAVAEACERAAPMGCKADGSRSAGKHAYGVRYRAIDWHRPIPRPADSVDSAAMAISPN